MSRAPTKYTPERVKRVLDAISTGAARVHAAAYGGIDHDTLLNWEKRYPAFRDQVLEAEARAVVGALANIRKIGNEGDWRALAFLLTSRHPDLYGRTVSEQRHSGPDGKEPVHLEHSSTPASIAAWRDSLAALGIGSVADAGPLLPPPPD